MDTHGMFIEFSDARVIELQSIRLAERYCQQKIATAEV